MNLRTQKNQDGQANDTASANSLTTNKRKRRYQIAAAILAVFVLHFAWQFSFVQRENLRVAEDSLDTAGIAVAPVDQSIAQPSAKIVETPPELTAQKTPIEEPVKTVVPARYSPPSSKSTPSETKSKSAREPRAERLRRAEKLLTGF